MPGPTLIQQETVVTNDGMTEPAHVSLDPSEYPRLQPRFQCRNGQLVKASTQTLIADRLNHAGYFCGKEYASFGGDVLNLHSTISSMAGSRNRWRFAGHTGPLANTIVAEVYMATEKDGFVGNPYVRLTIQDTSGNTLGYGDVYFGANATAVNDTPNEFGEGVIAIDCSGFPDTDIRGIFTDNDGGRAISATVYEMASPGVVLDGFVPSPYSIGRQIYDFDRANAAKLAAKLWKRNAAPLFTYTSNTDSTAHTTSSTTGVNVNDNASASPLPSVPGYRIDTAYLARKSSSSTVAVRFEAYISTTAASGAFVSLLAADGTQLAQASIHSSTTGAWCTTTANIPATLQTVYLFHGVASAGNVTTYAASLYPYA